MKTRLLAFAACALPALAGAGSALAPRRIADAEPPGDPLPIIAAASDGRAVAAGVVQTSAGIEVRLAVSGDFGLHWSAPRTIDTDADSLTPPCVSILPGGIVDIAWLKLSAGTPAVRWAVHRRSLDGGNSFLPLDWVAQTSGEATLAVSPGGSLALRLSGPTLTLSLSADGGRTWLPRAVPDTRTGSSARALWTSEAQLLICYTLVAHNGDSQVVCQRSDDRATTFAAPVTIATFPRQAPAELVLVNVGQGRVLLAWTDPGGTWLARSSDGGSTWSPVDNLDREPSWRVLLAHEPRGDVWLAPSRIASGPNLVLRSRDGLAWSSVPLLDRLRGCETLEQLVAFGGDRFQVNGWRTDDDASSWIPAVAPVPDRDPVAGVKLLRHPGGRLVLLTMEGTSDPPRLLARTSDDTGQSWSPPVQVNDLLDVYRWWWKALATRGGEFVVLWGRPGQDGCPAVSASRSHDGVIWSSTPLPAQVTSVHFLVELDNESILAGDVSGMATRSLDLGARWSPPWQTSFPGTAWSLEGVVGRLDGSLLLAADATANPWELAVYRSTDLGMSWSETAFAFSMNDRMLLLAAGGRVVAQGWGCSDFGCRPVSSFESWDDGRSWRRLAGTIPVDRYLGGADGSIFYSPSSAIWMDGPNGDRYDLGGVPLPSNVEPGVVLGPHDLALGYADWKTAQPPGLFFVRTRPAASFGILREDSITTLDPRPDLEARFPLPLHYRNAYPGMREPEAALLADSTRPLVLYGLGFATSGPLRMWKRDGYLRLSW